ncbi:hypothetical protein ES703_99533 [subsurface metagenome]
MFLLRWIYDGNGQDFTVAGPGSCYIERISVTGDGDRHSSKMVAIEFQGQSRCLKGSSGLGGLNAADDVHCLGIIGQEDYIRMAKVFMQAFCDSQCVFVEIPGSQLAEQIGTVPVVPFGHGDSDIFAFQGIQFLP